MRMTFDQYMNLVLSEARKNKEWRAGQTYFNVLSDERSDLEKKIMGTDLDPFYDDSRIPAFLIWLERNWNV